MAFSFGCSNDQSLDGAVEVILYHVPNWTTDGRIIAHKETVRYRETFLSEKDPLPGSNEIVIMDADGQNEDTLFSTNEINISRLELSPSGNYVGMLADVDLLLYSIDGDLLKKIEPEPTLSHIKFSPDETKLYGSEYSSTMGFFSIPNLDILTQNEYGGSGIWLNNDQVLYRDKEILLGMFTLSTNERFLYPLNTVPEVYISSENLVLSLGSTERYEYILGESEEQITTFSYSPYNYSDFTNQQLSPDGKEIVMGAKDFLNFYGTGIYILDIENGGIIRLR
jgi:hypothetical protein